MKYDLDKRVEDDIIRIAGKNGIKKVILFGSRARGTNSERSDIDLAVSGGNALDFYYDLEEQAWTSNLRNVRRQIMSHEPRLTVENFSAFHFLIRSARC